MIISVNLWASVRVARYQEERWVDLLQWQDSSGYAADPYHRTLMSCRLNEVVWVMSILWFMKSGILVNLSFRIIIRVTSTHMSTYYVRSAVNLPMNCYSLGAPIWGPTSKNASLWLTAWRAPTSITYPLGKRPSSMLRFMIEEGETFGQANSTVLWEEVLTDFWGDAIEIDDDAALTWMRQLTTTWACMIALARRASHLDCRLPSSLKNSETGAEDWQSINPEVANRLSQPWLSGRYFNGSPPWYVNSCLTRWPSYHTTVPSWRVRNRRF